MGRCLLVLSLLLVVAASSVQASFFPAMDGDGTRPDALALSVEVTLTPASVTAVITNSQNGSVTFGGNITVGKLLGSIQRVTVTLSASCIWKTEVSPLEMVFVNEGSQQFYLTVVVPSKTNVCTSEAIVYAHASDGFQSADASAKSTVAVAQYFKLSLGSDRPVHVIDDSPATIDGTLQIYNEGNGRDTYRIEVVSPPNGLVDYDVDESVVVASEARGDVDFTLFVELESGFTEGASMLVTFQVTSMTASELDQGASQQYSFTVYRSPTSDQIARDWPTYVGWGVGLGILGAVAITVVRRRRRRRGGRGSKNRPSTENDGDEG